MGRKGEAESGVGGKTGKGNGKKKKGVGRGPKRGRERQGRMKSIFFLNILHIQFVKKKILMCAYRTRYRTRVVTVEGTP